MVCSVVLLTVSHSVNTLALPWTGGGVWGTGTPFIAAADPRGELVPNNARAPLTGRLPISVYAASSSALVRGKGPGQGIPAPPTRIAVTENSPISALTHVCGLW